MRNLFIIAMLLVGAFMAGWFKVNREGESTTIEINRTEIRSDARKAIDRGRDFLDRREQQVAEQQVADPNQQYWPQEQVASQTDPWGRTYDAQQQPQAYGDPHDYPQDQRPPNQPSGRENPYSQPQPY
jgi:hypothetical protein